MINKIAQECRDMLIAMQENQKNETLAKEILENDLLESINMALERMEKRKTENVNEWAENLAKKFSVYND